MRAGRIEIDPFDPWCLQPNSYDFHLGETLLVYDQDSICVDGTTVPRRETIPASGLILEPRCLYLAVTRERTWSDRYAQMLFGNVSTGSFGIWTQISAPLAHVGSNIRWTLELRVVREVCVYPGLRLGKICFIRNAGQILPYGHPFFTNSGRYLADEVEASKMHEPPHHLPRSRRCG